MANRSRAAPKPSIDELLRSERAQRGILNGGGELRYLAKHGGIKTIEEMRAILRARGWVLHPDCKGRMVWVPDSKHLYEVSRHKKSVRTVVKMNRSDSSYQD